MQNHITPIVVANFLPPEGTGLADMQMRSTEKARILEYLLSPLVDGFD